MQVVADESRVSELITQLADWVGNTVQNHGSPLGWALIGLKSRGDLLADRIAQSLGPDQFAGRVGSLDITLYRDDLTEIGPQAVVQTTEIPFSIDGLDILLIDDVLMTGRTIRAALEALADLGRPRRVWLAVLADRGGRQLPIQPDFAAIDLAGHPGDDKLKLTIRPIHEQDALLTVPQPQAR